MDGFFDSLNQLVGAMKPPPVILTYPGEPLAPGSSSGFLEQIKPGGSYFPYALAAGVSAVVLVAILATRKRKRGR